MSHKTSLMHHRQQGFLVPMALFVVVGLGALAVTIHRMASASLSVSVLEGVSTQALYAADSGAQLAMHLLLFDIDDRANADAQCSALNGDTLTLSAAGIRGCVLTLTCDISDDSADVTSFYQLESSARCGSGDLSAVRTVSVSAVMRDE